VHISIYGESSAPQVELGIINDEEVYTVTFCHLKLAYDSVTANAVEN